MKEFVEKLIERLEESVSFTEMARMESRVGKKQTIGFGLGVRSAVKIVKDLASEHNNDFCEWKFVKSVADGGYFYSSGCSHKRFSDLHSFEFCPYCRKKIKVVK